MNAQSFGKGQDFGIRRVLISLCSPSSADQSYLSGISLHAGKQLAWRARRAEPIGWNAISELSGI